MYNTHKFIYTFINTLNKNTALVVINAFSKNNILTIYRKPQASGLFVKWFQETPKTKWASAIVFDWFPELEG